jgi:hypothetical protein
MKIYKKGILVTAIFCCLLWSGPGDVYSKVAPQEEQTFTPFLPSKEHKKINNNIVDRLKDRHYLKVVVDDQLSSKILYRYLDPFW